MGNVHLESAVTGGKSVIKTKNEQVVGRNIFRRARPCITERPSAKEAKKNDLIECDFEPGISTVPDIVDFLTLNFIFLSLKTYKKNYHVISYKYRL